MSIITGFSMFFISFSPLWASVLFIDIKSISEGTPNAWTEIISVALILICFMIALVVLMYELNPKKTNNQQEYTIISAKEEKTITAEYLLSYILPLYTLNFTLWNEVVLFLIFFSFIAFLSIRHNLFTVNVILELMQYKCYSCELKNEDGVSISKIVVCKETLSAQIGGTISTRAINNEYFVEIFEI